jgi:putative transposase
LSDENDEIADWLERLTENKRTWGFGLCFLYLRNVQGCGWNHKRVYRIYCEEELNLRVKPKKRLKRGKPQAIRVDNGPEYISGTLMTWAKKHGVRLEHIQPGKPQQNAYIERYNRTVRGEWLNRHIFETIEEAQNQATEWLWTYNN